MKKKYKSILYIGNNLTKKSKYNSTLTVLSNLFRKEGFTVYISSDKTNKFLRLISMLFSIVKYRNKVAYILIDTFSTTNFYYAFLTAQLARFFKIKYIPILHGGNLPYRISKSVRMSNLLFKNSFVNVAPSNYLKTEFERKGYIVKFIPNILEIENYPFKKRADLKPTLLWVRAFKEIYNPTMAIEVLFLLKKEYPNAKLFMVGPFVDSSYEKCQKLVEKYQLQGAVEFTGVLPKEEWHKKSKEFDVFINTTNFDNTPISVMEAMALGLPVVTTNVGGISYLLENNTDALLVAKNNAKEMVNAIKNVVDGKHKALPLKARQKVEKFDSPIVMNQWKEILN